MNVGLPSPIAGFCEKMMWNTAMAILSDRIVI
jgi:hypothetical protein